MTLIRELRERLGWSQERFAKEIDKSFSSVRGYESGRQPPLTVLAKMLGLAHRNRFEDLADRIESQAHEMYLEPARKAELIASGQMVDVGLYHSLLEDVLDSGDELALTAVRSVLLLCVQRQSKADLARKRALRKTTTEGEKEP